MNCKECIHEDVCKEWQYSISGSYNHPICRKPNQFKRKDKEHVRHGRWIINGRLWECSICGETSNNTCMGEPRANYCPNCGTKMVGKAGEQE